MEAEKAREWESGWGFRRCKVREGEEGEGGSAFRFSFLRSGLFVVCVSLLRFYSPCCIFRSR